MKWKKVTIQVNREYEELVENVLIANDFISYEIENGDIYGDNVTGEFYDELQPDEVGDEAKSVITFYREADSDDSELNGVREALKEALGVSEDPVEITVVDDGDWKDKWKEFFHSFTVDGIHIRPTWEEDVDPEAEIDIMIDPGMAFGTGKHESTYMILEHMREYLRPGESVADIGCGSGILSIAAAKLGAGRICGTDIDEDSVSCTYENLRQNGIEVTNGDYDCSLKRIDGEFLTGDIGSDEELAERLGYGGFNIVFANILADIIIGMADRLCALVAPSGTLITSGIIDFKEAEVIDRMKKCGFEASRVNAMGEWRSVVFVRTADK